MVIILLLIHLSGTVLNILHGLCPLLPQLPSDKFLLNITWPEKCSLASNLTPGSMLCAHHKPSSFFMNVLPILDFLFIGQKALWGKQKWLLLLLFPQGVGHIFKSHWAEKKNFKLIFIFSESLKMTEKLLLISHSKVSKHEFISLFLFYSISHKQYSCHQNLSLITF